MHEEAHGGGGAKSAIVMETLVSIFAVHLGATAYTMNCCQLLVANHAGRYGDRSGVGGAQAGVAAVGT